MKLKFIALFFLFLSSFSLILYGYNEDDDSEFTIDSKEDYRNTVKQIIGDLSVLRPSLLMNLCAIINPELKENKIDKALLYYQQQYQLLAAGFPCIIESDPNFLYLIEFIEYDLAKEQNTLSNATSCKTKSKCLNKIYNGLLGSAMIIDRILDGLNFKQICRIPKTLNNSTKL